LLSDTESTRLFLVRDQEVDGSNPFAPTNILLLLLRGLRAYPYLGFELPRGPRKLPDKRIRISLGILSKLEKRLPLQLLHHESDTQPENVQR